MFNPFSYIYFFLLLQKLYDLGARKVLVTGTGPLGCVPSELAQRGRNGQCAPDLQQAAALFNPQLVQMLNGLNNRLGNVFIAANTQQMHNDFISNPQAYGRYLTMLVSFLCEFKCLFLTCVTKHR